MRKILKFNEMHMAGDVLKRFKYLRSQQTIFFFFLLLLSISKSWYVHIDSNIVGI